MIPDFQNFSLEKCKKLILEYQKTKDPEIFKILLARFDRYILFQINNYKKYTSFLEYEEPQDLYHTGIIGFQKGLLSFKKHLPTRMITLRIGSYIVAELRQTYIYKLRESQRVYNGSEESSPELLYEIYPSAVENYLKQLDKITINMILDSSFLSDSEKEILNLRYKKGETIMQIAKERGVSYNTIHICLDKALNKLRKKLIAKEN